MSQSVDLDDLLTSAETAALLGIKNNTLEIWRHKKNGKGPEFIKFGDAPQAPVRYRRSEVIAWLTSRKFANTSAYSPHGQASSKHHNRSSSDASA